MRIMYPWLSLEMQWAMNQMGNSRDMIHLPAPGYSRSMQPHMTLKMPEIRDA